MKGRIVSLADIVVSRERFREDLGDIDGLADSILKFGQLQPVIVDEEMEIIAGFRRFTAISRLYQDGIWADGTVWIVEKSEVDELMAREIELEENIRRKQMTPAEEIRAIAELDMIKQRQDPSWGQTQTAAAVGVHRSQVSSAIKYAKMVELFPELKEAKSVRQLASWADAKASSIARTIEVRDNPADYSDIGSKIILGDSVEVIKSVPSESFHAIITDPPFGIDFDERSSRTIGSVSAYEDSEESYERLLGMGTDLFRTLKPNGWLIWFLGISWYERAKTSLRESGFIVDEIPLIWDRSEGRNFTLRPDRYFARSYDIALHCLKGSPEMVLRNRPNIIKARPVEGGILAERPIELYAEIIKRLTIPGETVADFFVGSGSCPAAAASLGRNYFGVERDPERRAVALQKIKANTAEVK